MKVLIVSPRFAPSNAADSHRARLLLPYLQKNDCTAEVLAVDSRDVPCPVDPWLSARLPSDVPVHRVRAWNISGWGVSGLGQRSFVSLLREGNRLLSNRSFDLVFFSTSEFFVHCLGPIWKSKFGVPFCMDYQDPWVDDYFRSHPSVEPPGGRLKFSIANMINRFAERVVVPHCSGFLAVSSRYLTELDGRYGHRVHHQPRLVVGFPGEPSEFRDLTSYEDAEGASVGARSAACTKVLQYVGAIVPGMAGSLRAFFAVWREMIDSGHIANDELRFQATGTTYAPNNRGISLIKSIAREYRLQDYVTDTPDRLGYRVMLATLVKADGLVIFGSDDPGYTASKIYPYLLARRPLLVIFSSDTSVSRVLADVGGAVYAPMLDRRSTAIKRKIRLFLRAFLRGHGTVALNEQRFDSYCAQAQATRVVEWMSDIVRQKKGQQS